MTIALLLPFILSLAGVPGDDDLVGLWGSESVFGPQVRGELTLVHDHGWTIRIGGYESAGRVDGDTLRAALPGGQGDFRAVVSAARDTIHAFWMQPSGQLSWRFATPVELVRQANGVWRGTVRPLDERWSIYLDVTRASDGSLRGAFHNPDMNWRGGAATFLIRRDRDTLRFIDDKGKQRVTVGYDSAQHVISMDFGVPIALTRRSRDGAIGYFPRTPAVAARDVVYRVPLARPGDGWKVGRARDEGLDESKLAELVSRIAVGDPAAPLAPAIHSLIIARHGRIVLEEYFHGFDATRTHDLRSASKTFVSVLMGAEMLRGARLTAGSSVYDYFPAERARVAADPRRSRITIGQLLSHSSGLACDESDDASPGYEDTMQGQTAQPDWYRFTLALPLVHEPTAYAYCSAGINLAAGAIGQASGDWLTRLFDRDVARPLGIRNYAVQLTPTGDLYGGGGMQMLPRDFLKFGVLYLNGGTWNGRRVVPRSWVETSTALQATAPTGSDGYGWHRYQLKSRGQTYDEYEANGNGGQFLIVIPKLDLAVVFTAGNYGQYLVWRKFRDELVPAYVLDAIAIAKAETR